MGDVPVTEITKERGIYWVRQGGGMKKTYLGEIYNLLKDSTREFVISRDVKMDLVEHMDKNQLSRKF